MSDFTHLPKVSVVTIAYNAVNTIADTIRSVISQTYPNIEYIIVDGGSTDGTLEVIDAYRDKITRFVSGPDKGISDGFNKGISMATGEWIALLNADDWYAADAVEYMISRAAPKDDVICGDIMMLGANGYSLLKKSKVSWLKLGMYVMHPTCFVRSSVYREVGGYDLSLKIAMDYDVFLRIQRMYKIRYINHLVTYMRAGGNSSNVTGMHVEELAVMRRHLNAVDYAFSWLFNYLNRLRWRFTYRDPFSIPAK